MNRSPILNSSFRDPSGFLFRNDAGTLLRQVNRVYETDFGQLKQSGLIKDLVERGWVISHEEVTLAEAISDQAVAVLKPEVVPFISYPAEWSFSQLKDAAILTLDVALRALDYGMTLKDASAFNVQFVGAVPVFIDTLSFTAYREGEPWVAYRQFCRHFLAPLALMSRCDIRLSGLLANAIDGVDLDLASRLLPTRTRFSPGLLMHLHLNSRFENTYGRTTQSSSQKKATKSRTVSKAGLVEILKSLKRTVENLTWQASGTEWADYYDDNSYSDQSFQTKRAIVAGMIRDLRPGLVWDLGANTGVFSRIAAESGAYTCSMDIDPACVDRCYRAVKSIGSRNVLPLLMNLAVPTPAIGWQVQERASLLDRGPCHTAMALALVHHLAIGNNVPLERVARFFAAVCENLIIEFVPKDDPQTQRLLQGRVDIFEDYHTAGFENAFRLYFELKESRDVEEGGRVIYRMKNRSRAGGQVPADFLPGEGA